MMFKHANTLEPGTKVRRVRNGVKVAGDLGAGEVTGVQDGSFRVRFNDGSIDYVPAEELERAGS